MFRRHLLRIDRYESLVHEQQDQSLIISGESGAGKTECMKLLLQHLTEKSRLLVRVTA